MNYVLHGEEQYRLQQSLQKIIKSHTINDDEMNTISYDALKTDVDTVLEDAQTVPFFSEHKVILIQNANFLSANDDTGWDVMSLQAYLENPLETTILIMIVGCDKLDSRKKIVKQISKLCKVLTYRRLDEEGKKNYLFDEIKKRKLMIESAAKEELLKRLPMDMRAIRSEIDKLELYGEPITKSAVEHLVCRPIEENAFTLVDAVVKRDVRRAFHIWEDMQVANNDVIFLIATLAGQFRFLFQVKQLAMEGKEKGEIASTLHAHPYRVQLGMESIRNLHSSQILHILEQLATLDQEIKAGRLQKEIGFEMFLLSLQGG